MTPSGGKVTTWSCACAKGHTLFHGLKSLFWYESEPMFRFSLCIARKILYDSRENTCRNCDSSQRRRHKALRGMDIAHGVAATLVFRIILFFPKGRSEMLTMPADLGHLLPGETLDPNDLKQEEALVKGRVAVLLEQVQTLADFTYHANLGRAVARLLDQVEYLYLSRHDEEQGDRGGLPIELYLLTSQDELGKRVHAESEDLLDLFSRVYGSAKKKKCNGCLELKLMSAYSRLRASKDGRNRRCRVCERKRVADNKVKKKPKEEKPVVFEYKTCKMCGHSRLKESFKKDVSRPDGLWVYCSGCERKRQKKIQGEDKRDGN